MTSSMYKDILSIFHYSDTMAQSTTDSFYNPAKELASQELQFIPFDYMSLWIAIITCTIAIVTCFVACLQLKMQRKEFNDNQEKDKILRLETKTYVNQIRNQILNNSLIRIIENKYSLLEYYSNLYNHLSKNKTLLLKTNQYGYEKKIIHDINKIQCILNVIKDTLSVFEKGGTRIRETKDVKHVLEEMMIILRTIEKQEGVGDNLIEIDNWLKRTKEIENEFVKAIDKSYECIRTEIKQNVLNN